MNTKDCPYITDFYYYPDPNDLSKRIHEKVPPPRYQIRRDKIKEKQWLYKMSQSTMPAPEFIEVPTKKHTEQEEKEIENLSSEIKPEDLEIGTFNFKQENDFI